MIVGGSAVPSVAFRVILLADLILTDPYLPASLVPTVQKAFDSYDGFNEEDRQKIGWRNAFELFPTLKEKFPEMQ